MGNPVVHFEVSGADGPALQKFYGDLFGWHVQPMPEMNYGFVDTHAGAGVNGGIATSPEGAPGVTFYVEVPDPQASLDKASSIGGSTVMPVTEIPDIVTFAQFADPEGNVIGLVKSGEGPGVSGGDGIPVSWFEVLGNDPDALLAFYTDLF
ncbi:MAG: VOC family protein, partial [Candidatus Methylomirabilales bacterium]